MPPGLSAALQGFRSGVADKSAVIEAIRGSRLLIPLVATLGEMGVGDHGLMVEKSADLGIVTVAGPDGRRVMPVFSSVESMRSWNPEARPVPIDAVRVALAAAAEQTDLVVLDPASSTEFVLRRPALWAIAQSLPWVESHVDTDVIAAFQASIRGLPSVIDIHLAAGDPTARLVGPDTLVRMTLAAGLDGDELAELLAEVQRRWSRSEVVAARVDSLAVSLERVAT